MTHTHRLTAIQVKDMASIIICGPNFVLEASRNALTVHAIFPRLQQDTSITSITSITFPTHRAEVREGREQRLDQVIHNRLRGPDSSLYQIKVRQTDRES